MLRRIKSPSPTSSHSDRVTRLRKTRHSEERTSFGEKSFLLKAGIAGLYAVAVHNVVSTVFKCASTVSPMYILDAVSVACRAFFAALTSHLYYRSYPDIARFLHRDRKLDPELYQARRNSRAMQCKRWLGLGLVAAYGAAMTVHEVVWLYRYGPLVYFSSQLYGLDPIRLRVPPNMIAFAAILDFTAFNVTVLVPAVCIVHFVSVCDLIVLKGDRFRSMLQASCAAGSDGLKPSNVRKLHASYVALWDAVQYVDKRLRSAIFFWYVDTVLNIVVSVRAVQHTLAHFNPYAASGAYVHAAYLVLAFLLVSLSAASLVAQRRHLLRDLCRLVCAVDAEDDDLCNQACTVLDFFVKGNARARRR
ncbi:hypothetical protein V5799_029088 [Amblyomma americanum]|uniref:Uncharacterized protein n=1 Tax=Amblyomma americanum TaxID=6943 RepID=A0AAQ4ES50_AMBAM